LAFHSLYNSAYPSPKGLPQGPCQRLALIDSQMLTYPLPEIHHPTKIGGAQGEWEEDVDEEIFADH
jgi:hypothetical protein